ncbi:stage II sporulation protein D [Brevibacillus humidisoli]|uniref:stage II sporulation protein D n=1 Tax=Brevibacillus humidisoli TaxID=2895522 RepID=UPI001E3A50C6|nr:stage II sporulation protein D [Brevibacillus humidisoli]UFJ40144.1 stage II sporulation protein D [Brevibacillus humidisoli]
MKRIALTLLVLLPALVVFMPAVLVYYLADSASDPLPSPKPEEDPDQPSASSLQIHVYRTEQQRVETVPLDRYLEGVVAAEMPAEFELEALKAQAMAARTYIIRRLAAGRFDDVPEGAHVLDTVKHQVYLDEQQQKIRWGSDHEWKSQKISQAVSETRGMILTYQGKPIDATFFSTSNGFTEDAEDYWQHSIPYLQSVASPWDQESPRFREQVVMDVAELEQKLGTRLDLTASSAGNWYTVLERTTGNRIGRVRIGSKVYSGREVREKLGLNSTAFTMQLSSGRVVITTKGYGHGVGMSQWGANGMAKSGKSAEQIVKYFYQGVDVQNYQQVIKI